MHTNQLINNLSVVQNRNPHHNRQHREDALCTSSADHMKSFDRQEGYVCPHKTFGYPLALDHRPVYFTIKLE